MTDTPKLDRETLLEAARIIEHRGVCAVTMINADERLEEKKAYAWDALHHAVALRTLAAQQPEREPVWIVFDGPPGPECGRFVDVHTSCAPAAAAPKGKS